MSLTRAVADEFLRLASLDGTQITTMQLQKLVYFAHCWSMAIRDADLVDEPFEAWRDGPVVRSLWRETRGYESHVIPTPDEYADAWKLDLEDTEIIEAVWRHYGRMGPFELSELTHREEPWIAARGDTPPEAKSQAVLDDSLMCKFYASHEQPESIREFKARLEQREREAAEWLRNNPLDPRLLGV